MRIFRNELKMFKEYLLNETKQTENESKCSLFITSLEDANKRFLTSIISSIIVILLIALLYGFKAVISSAIVLSAIPYFIARVESSNNVMIEAPFRKITEITNFRNLYATSVLIVGVGIIFASSILSR